MKIEDEFRVDVPVEEAWRVLLDVERIAPCMPGAQLQEVEGDEYRGDREGQGRPDHRAVQGRSAHHRVRRGQPSRRHPSRGPRHAWQGNASATIDAVLQPDGDGTRVSIDTDLTITGKVAQFGRGVMADVSAKLLAQFVACLERDVLSSRWSTRPAVERGRRRAATPTSAPAPIDAPEAEPVDLLRTAGAPVLKRVVPVAAAVIVVIVVVVLILLLR